MKTLTTEQLTQKIKSNADFSLLNVTGEQYFQGEMIPGSGYIPVETLESVFTGAKISKDANIVVYCAGPTCSASHKAAEKLESLGYTNVERYEAGIAGWKEAGFKLAGGSCGSSCGCSTTDKRAAG